MYWVALSFLPAVLFAVVCCRAFLKHLFAMPAGASFRLSGKIAVLAAVRICLSRRLRLRLN